METAICETIAIHCPFTTKEIRDAWRRLGSLDLVLAAVEYCAGHGFSNLSDGISMALAENATEIGKLKQQLATAVYMAANGETPKVSPWDETIASLELACRPYVPGK